MVQKYGVHFPLYLGPSGSNVFHPESSVDWFLSTSSGVTFSEIAKAAPLDAVKMVPNAGWLQVFFAAGLFELTAYNRQWTQGRDIPGDYGYDPLGFTKREGGFDSEELTRMRMMELKNGRVAMMVSSVECERDSNSYHYYLTQRVIYRPLLDGSQTRPFLDPCLCGILRCTSRVKELYGPYGLLQSLRTLLFATRCRQK